MLAPSDVIAGRYRLVRELGQGGMGRVFEVVQLRLERRVAIKVLNTGDPTFEAQERFAREAKVLARLNHAHIAQVIDTDFLPSGDPYIVMEYLDGRDLKRELDKRGPLPLSEAVGYVDGRRLGVVPAETALEPGSYRIVLRHPDYETAATTVHIRNGQIRRVSVPLDERPGILSQWWFWTGAGAVLAGGVIATVALTTERDAERGDIAPGTISAPLQF